MTAPTASPHPDLVSRFRADYEALAPAGARLGLAVSGGPDSLALLFLAHAAFAGTLRAATVDHGLRAASADEAASVAEVCAALGVSHETLAIGGKPGGGSLQAWARSERYRLLGDWARAHDIAVIATAHHIDDQAETLVMRLLRGSGVGGLAGVRSRGRLPADAPAPLLVRPLLGWRRAELADIAEGAGLTPACDPGNDDERFDRVRIRRRLAATDWLDPAPLARSAAALAEADEALNWAAAQEWEKRARTAGERLTIEVDGLPPELTRRLLNIAVHLIGGGVPRGAEITRLQTALGAGDKATLAGVLCTGGPVVWRFEPAPPRRG